MLWTYVENYNNIISQLSIHIGIMKYLIKWNKLYEKTREVNMMKVLKFINNLSYTLRWIR